MIDFLGLSKALIGGTATNIESDNEISNNVVVALRDFTGYSVKAQFTALYIAMSLYGQKLQSEKLDNIIKNNDGSLEISLTYDFMFNNSEMGWLINDGYSMFRLYVSDDSDCYTYWQHHVAEHNFILNNVGCLSYVNSIMPEEDHYDRLSSKKNIVEYAVKYLDMEAVYDALSERWSEYCSFICPGYDYKYPENYSEYNRTQIKFLIESIIKEEEQACQNKQLIDSAIQNNYDQSNQIIRTERIERIRDLSYRGMALKGQIRQTGSIYNTYVPEHQYYIDKR